MDKGAARSPRRYHGASRTEGRAEVRGLGRSLSVGVSHFPGGSGSRELDAPRPEERSHAGRLGGAARPRLGGQETDGKAGSRLDGGRLELGPRAGVLGRGLCRLAGHKTRFWIHREPRRRRQDVGCGPVREPSLKSSPGGAIAAGPASRPDPARLE